MDKAKGFLAAELIILFILTPILLALSIPISLKLISVGFAIAYCIWISKKHQLISFASISQMNFKENWKRLILTFTLVAILSTLFLYFTQPENLFIVVKQKPLMWLIILVFYAIFSVLPQEILYRSFFFKRYETLFNKSIYLILVNIMVFPLAHLLFNNNLVLLVTLVGGILFTITYYRTKSVLFTSIEHAIYGNWLFTIGMGEMLAFPMPQ